MFTTLRILTEGLGLGVYLWGRHVWPVIWRRVEIDIIAFNGANDVGPTKSLTMASSMS